MTDLRRVSQPKLRSELDALPALARFQPVTRLSFKTDKGFSPSLPLQLDILTEKWTRVNSRFSDNILIKCKKHGNNK